MKPARVRRDPCKCSQILTKRSLRIEWSGKWQKQKRTKSITQRIFLVGRDTKNWLSLYQDVYRYGFWLCKSQPLAEDLVQETFLRAWRSLDSLKNDNAAKAWLFTILRRENARLYERYRPVLVDVDEQVIVEKDSIEPDNKMERRWLLDAMNRLEKDYREPLLLQIIGGFSGKEIALILDINSNTVMTRLFRARSKVINQFASKPGKISSQLFEIK